jgi:acetyltransferase-like isoleucine patch superfamily enzyme
MFKFLGAIRLFIYSVINRKISGFGYIGTPLLIKGFMQLTIKRNVRIFPGARIEVHGDGKIIINENVSIGQSLHLVSQQYVEIGADTLISSNVLITDLAHDYTDVNKPIIEQKHLVRETIIGKNCFIGAGAIIQPGTVLGKHCVVGANSVVAGNYPDYSVIAGAPAKTIKRYDEELEQWIKLDT